MSEVTQKTEVYPSGREGVAGSERFTAVIIFLLTLVYLCLELPFSVDLLNGVGSAVDPSELQRLEIAGRLISGLALVLLVWQFAILPASGLWQNKRLWTVCVCLLVTPFVVAAVYLGEGALVSREPQVGGEGPRQLALATALFAQGVERGQVDIKGLPFTEASRKQPDAMAFMALLPLMSSQMSDIREKLLPVAEEMVRQRLVDETDGPQAFYERTYASAIASVQKEYDHYRNAIQAYNRTTDQYEQGLSKYQQTIAGAQQQGEKAYWSYRQELARILHSQGPAPAYECPLIRARVNRKYRIKLPSDWNCWDKATFARAVAARIREEASHRLASAEEQLSRHRPPDLGSTFVSFLRQPQVQKELRSSFQRACIDLPDGALLSEQTPASWQALVYKPMLYSRTKDIVNHFIGNVDDFRKGGAYYEQGQAAHDLLIIPAIALFFSLLGALLHIVKIIVEVSIIILPRRAVYWGALFTGRWKEIIEHRPTFALRMACLLGAILLIATPAFMATPVTRSPVFESISQSIRAGENGNGSLTGHLTSSYARWAIQTEAAIYPINEGLRHFVNQFIDFKDGWLVRTIAKHSTPIASPLGTKGVLSGGVCRTSD